MTRLSPVRRRGPVGGATLVAAATALALVLPGSAAAHNDRGRPVPPPPASPTSANQIQNIDQVKTAIKAYYGDTTTSAVDPVPNSIDGKDNPIHTFSDTSAYAHEVGGILGGAAKYLSHPRPKGHAASGAKKAILLDVDDTSLNTYDYEIYSNFVYNPTTNGYFVADPAGVYKLRAVPHMVALENYAAARGYTVFFLTGRPVAQLAGTVDNLKAAGYQFDPANVYTKDPAAPWLQDCVSAGKVTCTTIQYKSKTRAHIESLGYDIVANFGDQYSDLIGGFADRTFKIPNPMYYLP